MTKKRMARAAMRQPMVSLERTTDVDLALSMLSAFTPESKWAEVFTLEGEPLPWERARYNRTTETFFKSDRMRSAQQAVIYGWRLAHSRRPPVATTVAIVTLFFVSTDQPKDGDNLQKLVFDAATRALVWTDDRLVKRAAWAIERDIDRPRTVVAMAPVLTTQTKAPLLVGAHDERTDLR